MRSYLDVIAPLASAGMAYQSSGIHPQLQALMNEAQSVVEEPAPKADYFSYGKAVDAEDVLNMARGGLAHLAQGGLPNRLQGLNVGGLPHIPQFSTGSGQNYVRGAGDGQSDDIPAMLADGEYVIDAETVAQLGNGSNEAGAEILDRMRENIRKHKRSAPIDEIPPKAKSPLEYMRGR